LTVDINKVMMRLFVDVYMMLFICDTVTFCWCFLSLHT